MTTQQLPVHPQTGINRISAPALAVGVIALVSSLVVVGGAVGVVGAVLGAVALQTAARTGVGRGQAVAAVVLSGLAIIVSVWMIVVAVWFAHKTQDCYHLNEIDPWYQCVRDQLHRH